LFNQTLETASRRFDVELRGRYVAAVSFLYELAMSILPETNLRRYVFRATL